MFFSLLNDRAFLLIIPFLLGISGMILVAIVGYSNRQCEYGPKIIRATGVLIGFRKFAEHKVDLTEISMSGPKYSDLNHNEYNSRPLVRFQMNGEEVVRHCEWSTPNLDGDDIDKSFPIICFANDEGKVRVILDSAMMGIKS